MKQINKIGTICALLGALYTAQPAYAGAAPDEVEKQETVKQEKFNIEEQIKKIQQKYEQAETEEEKQEYQQMIMYLEGFSEIEKTLDSLGKTVDSLKQLNQVVEKTVSTTHNKVLDSYLEKIMDITEVEQAEGIINYYARSILEVKKESFLEKGMTNEAYSFDAFKCAFTARTELQNRLEEMYSKEKVEELRQNNLGINVLYSIQYDE